MDAGSTVGGYVAALKRSERLGDQVVHHRTIQELAARCAPNVRPWPRAIQNVLRGMGIEELYSHQARATDLVRSGRHVVVATPTASGKTLIYNLPVLERVLGNPECRALYLFPLKALAQDQLRNFEALTAAWPRDARPSAAIYDGDTTDYKRRKIRENPPNVLLTNPEMLHLSICPHHESWSAFLADLQFVVVDEVHTYRGVLGSHMAQVFRRLRRICERFGARPTFIFCSATVANPEELAGQLTGLEVETITESGAPQGARHFVFLNPYEGAAQASILLLQAALHRGLRTIVYTQSRKITELVSLWAQQRSGPFKDRISAYRSGFLPEERREIEARMTSGELLAVVSTSALELGIDIGALDICILVGYPGTVMATLQRGGRVGRSLRESAVLMLAHEDALDQYFMRNPSAFFDKGPEAAVLNPCNPVILSRHLECAAAEMPLRDEESWFREPKVLDVLRHMERSGQLLRGADGAALYSRRKRPQREINLRGAGSVYHIEIGAHRAKGGEAPGPNQKGGESVGTVDEHRAFKETHPGAVYLHRGLSYVVADLNLATRTVRVERQKVNYFTRPRVTKETEIIEVLAEKPIWGARLFLGRLKVTETVTGYETRLIRGSKLLRITNLDLPPLIFETEGIWFVIPPAVQRASEDEFLHFMGGIHALEHAAIGIMPLQVMTDRNDLGGISTPMHPQLGMSAVFIYDGIPGGVGLSRQAYAKPEELLERTLGVITSCDCEFGCPACVHSPKCGSGNRPIDKNAALRILQKLREAPTMAPLHLEIPQGSPDAAARSLKSTINPEVMHEPQGGNKASRQADTPPRFGVLDVETRRSAAEVGGWHRAERMGVSVAVLYDSADAGFHVFLEQDMNKLMQHLKELELVVGFNVKRFDYKVLSAYAGKEQFDMLPTLDMLDVIQQRLGYRLGLDHLAKATLMAEKTADGLQALAWWAEGRVQEIIDYCTKDVAITRDLYLYGRDKGYLLFTNKARKLVRLPVEW